MDSWFSLVLLCGLVIIESLNGAAGNVTPHNVPHNPLQNLKKAVHTVQEYYDLTNKEWMGRAVFAPYLGKTETCTCEELMLAAMLNSYVEMFSDMMKKSKEIETSLKGMQANVTHLQKNKFSKEQRVLTQLQEIKLKNVNDMTIQGGAVNDFLPVYEMAHRLENKYPASENGGLSLYCVPKGGNESPTPSCQNHVITFSEIFLHDGSPFTYSL